ncbi:MAG: hypothetical protein LBE57_01450 [Methanosarcinales archaeon]|jgi:hypothetical protein|nr:hypothetical protein [Methanosarcinales archaeon]
MKSEPINAKNFMEFFEKQCGVKFVDIEAGKTVLDIINDEEKELRNKGVCSNCKYGAKGDGVFVHVDDIVCINADSSNVADFVFSNSSCEWWEQGEGDFSY